MNNVGAKRFNLYCVKDTAPKIPHHFRFSRTKRNPILLGYLNNCSKRECYLIYLFFSIKISNFYYSVKRQIPNLINCSDTHVPLQDTCFGLRSQNEQDKSICLLSLHISMDTFSTSKNGAGGHITWDVWLHSDPLPQFSPWGKLLASFRFHSFSPLVNVITLLLGTRGQVVPPILQEHVIMWRMNVKETGWQ